MDISGFLWIVSSLLTGFAIFYFYQEYEKNKARTLLKNRVLYFMAGALLSGFIMGTASCSCKKYKSKFSKSRNNDASC